MHDSRLGVYEPTQLGWLLALVRNKVKVLNCQQLDVFTIIDAGAASFYDPPPL